MLNDSTNRFGAVSQGLHWLSAVLTLGLFGLGIWMVELGYYDDWYHQAPALHISFGLLLVALTLARLGWRAFQAPLNPIESISIGMRRLAKGTKYALYGLLFVLFISGYLITTADGVGARFFDWFAIPASIQLTSNNVDIAGSLHLWGAWLLVVLVAMHAGAALMHHIVYRDKTLKRMMPFSKNQP